MNASTQSIREIVANQTTAAAILQRFDIDLCAYADRSLHSACAELQLSIDQVMEKLADAAIAAAGAEPSDPASLPATRLIQHIVRVHHRALRQDLPGLVVLAEKLAAKRGGRAPELARVRQMVQELRDEVLAHIEKEEQALFPLIAEMDDEARNGRTTRSSLRAVGQPIAAMRRDHETAGQIFTSLRELTHGFETPSWACATHCALYGGLRAFGAGLQQHLYLENEVLFPRAAAMERTLHSRG